MQKNYAGYIPESRASVILDLPIADRVAGLTGIRTDLITVANAASCLRTELATSFDPIILEALTWQIVVLYARCFDANADGRRSSLSLDHLKGFSADLRTMHDGLVSRRKQTFAHAGEQCSYRTIVHLLPLTAGREQLGLTCSTEGPGPISDPETATLIVTLCESLVVVVEKLIEEMWPRLVAAIEERETDILKVLSDGIGKHALPEQQAIHAIRQMLRD